MGAAGGCDAITTDRLREAERARLVRRGADEQPQEPRRARRLRAFATRLALTFSVPR